MTGIDLNKKEADQLNNEITAILKANAKDFNSPKYCTPLELNSGKYLIIQPKKEWFKLLNLTVTWKIFKKSDIKVNNELLLK